MNNPYVLVLIGLVLIFIEFYVPGIILGSIGAIFIMASFAAMLSVSDSPVEIILFAIGTALAIYGLIKFAIWKIPRTRQGYSIYLKGDQEGYIASAFDESAIGREGVVLTDLKPGGYILIGNTQHQALSESGYMSRGEKVIVLRGEGESLIVKRKE